MIHFDIPNAVQVRWSSYVSNARRLWLFYTGLFVLTLAVFFLAWLYSAPKDFPRNSLITIPENAAGSQFAHLLKENHAIRSELAFRILARITGYDRHLTPGVYAFTRPIALDAMVVRIGNGEHGISPIRITFTEGMTNKDIGNTLVRSLPGFDEKSFLSAASTSEGYLFPETYFFMPGDASDAIVVRLKSQFSSSIATITPDILASKRSFSDIVIMASILEREARTPEDMRIVAGILWNRIDAKQRLQVDATFGYIHQENGYTPTAKDLESTSPYNTYRHLGLPPSPISNPGLNALYAAVNPEKTDYFYYLTGKDGKMHYAKTFEEHKKNRTLYLD